MNKFYQRFFKVLSIITFTLFLNLQLLAQVPNCATALLPANGGTLVNSSTPFTWTAPAGTVTGYRIYIGTTSAIPTDLVNGTIVAGTSYTYGGSTVLTCGTTYYWQVVPYNGTGPAIGCGVQSFKMTAAPTAVAGTAINTCSNSPAVAITAGSSATNAASTTWTSNGTGGFANATSLTTATYTPSAADITAGSVILTLTSVGYGTCATATSTKTLTITAAPSVASGTAIAACGSTAVNITTGSSAANYNTITWTSTGTGTFASNNSLTATTYAPSAADITAGSRTLTLTATGNGSCATVTSTKTITIGTTPTAVAGTAVSMCSNVASTNITAGSSSANAASITWTSSGTGTVTNPTNITTATYTPSAADITAGSVTLTLTANPNGSCIAATSTKTLTITAAPSVASGTAIAACGSTAVNITTGSSAANYNTITWTSSGTGAFANNNSLTATTYTPTAADITAGTRTLTLTATGNGTCATITSVKNITITAAPTAVAGTAIATCGSVAVNITTGSSSINNSGINWTSSGTGTFTNPTNITTATYAPSAADITAGSITLTLTANGNGVCLPATSTKTLTVSPAPLVASGTAIATCGSVPVNITAGSSASNYNTITWTSSGTGTFANNNSLTATTYTPTAADVTAGTRTLTLTATGLGACAAVTSAKTITISAAPTAVAGTAISTCSNSAAVNITTGSSSTNNSGIIWTSSGTGTFTNPTNITTATYAPSAADITAGSVILTLTANGNGACLPVTSNKTLTITTLPVATFSYTGTPYCNNTTNPLPTFSGAGVGGVFSSTVGLSFVSTSTGQVNLTSSTANTYTVTNTIAASGGCAVVSATSSITINAVPVITVQPANVSTCIGNSGNVTFAVTATGTGLTYQWLENGVPLSNTGIYSGVTTNTLSLTGVTASNNYSVVVSGTCSPAVTSSAATLTVYSTAPGTPSVFGNGVWNVYCYGAINFTSYMGYYVEPLFSFDSRVRWTSGASPSIASGYQGCFVPATNISLSFKQTNFTPGTYSLNVNFQDDGFTMFLNGTQVFQNPAYTNSLQSNVWTGTLGASDQVEFRLTQGGGGSGLMVTFVPVATPVNSITAGTIAGNQSICTGEVPAQVLSNAASAVPTGCSLGSYQWQSSTDSLIWTPISGANSSTYTVPALTATTWYNRIANGACGATATSNAIKVTVFSSAPGTPTVYGNGVWNCYAYALQTFGTYKGYYVEPLLSFDTRNRWLSGTAPSLASGYQGCLVPATQMSISMKQTNFTPGYYSLSVSFQDDGFTMLVNGVQVFQNNTATGTLQSNVWTGQLDASSQVELRLTQGTGGSGLAATFAPYTPPALLGGTIGGANQHICSGDIPQLPLSNVTPASGGCTWRANSYQWQSSLDSLNWTNISAANSTAYTIPTTLTADTYYRRTITDDCGQVSFSNVVKVSLNNIVYGDPTIFGTNQWNVYVYKDAAFSTYAGYYVEPSTSFLTTNRFLTSQSPSYASGYLGCNVPISNFSASMKRQGVTPSSTGVFQIDLASLDDVGTLIIDGTQVYTKNCCVAVGAPILNIWTGPLNSSSQIEWRWVGGGTPNYSALTFTEITASALLPGTITGSDTICSGNKPTLGFTSTSVPSGGCNFSYYQWQYSTDSLTWVNLSGSNSASYTPVLSIYQKTYFRRVAYDICGTPSPTLPVVINMRTTIPGNPVVFGTNTWNAYCFNDAAYGQYVGYYTENNLSFDTKNRFPNSQPPSSTIAAGGSLGFSGCKQLYTYWSVSFKRKGLGSNPVGYYQIDMNYQDDGTVLLINGVQVFQNGYTPSLQSNVWTGLINNTTELELKLYNNAGPGSAQITFTYLGATPPTNLVAGTLACSPNTFCSGDLPYVLSATPASGGCAATYQWQSSPNGSTWTNITGATSLNFYSITAITATTYYRRTATDGCGNTANTAACMLTTGATVTNPGIGNNVWNCLAYNATDFTSNYSGYYTEPLLSFSTTNRFTNTSPPSYASGYVGCQTSAATFSVRMLRTNFTPATYQIDIPTHDDYMYLLINGVQVYTAACCVNNLTAWVGNLGATDVVELRYSNNYGPGNLSATFTVVTPTGTITPSVIGADQLICNATVPAQLTTVTAASSFCYLTYQWQSSTTSISSGYTNISGATLTTYSPAALTQTTYYRLLISDACGRTANSNAITITVNGAVIATTNGSPQTICSGQIPAAITASPTGGNGSYTYVWQSSTTGPSSGFSAVGVTAATYAPAAVTVSTWYNVIVTSCGGNATSASTAVTVAPATAITTQPVNYVGCVGTTGTFTVGAVGYGLSYQWQQKIGAGAFTNIGTNSSTFSNTITLAMGLSTYTYQCIVTSSLCTPTSVISSSVTLTPNAAPTITGQPVAATTCSGSATPVIFSVTATSATGYQWYDATGNIALTNTGIYSGVTTSTLSITGVTAAASYYCVVSGTPACAGSTQSSTVALTVQSVIGNNTIASNQSICANATVAALVGTTPTGGGGAGTYTYQWSSSTDNATYNPITGANAINYTPPATLTVTTYFKRTVSSTTCVVNTTTTPVTITVTPQPATPIVTGTTTYCVGDALSLTANTASATSYTWTTIGTGFSGAATANLTNPGIQTTNVGGGGTGTYTVKATIGSCTSLAASVLITVNRLPAITTQPAASTPACLGAGVNISVVATGTGLTYQWQQSADGVAPFTNIVNNGVYNNAKTATLLLYPTASINGYYFRCVISGTCTPSVTSNNSILSVYNPIAANTVATSQAICGGATPATLTGSVPTGGTGVYTYQWYTSIDNNTYTVVSGATSQNYSPGALTQDTWYNRIAMSPSTGTCGTNTSSSLLITVYPSTNISTEPNSTTTCPSVSATMGLVATGAGLTYKWQVNPLTGVYINVSNASLYSGYNTNTLTFTNPSASMNGYLYRCIVTGNCAAGGFSIDTSIVAVLNISTPATINTQPASYNVCNGANVTYTVGATGASPLTYQWQQRIAPGSYVNLSDGGIVSGSTTSSLSLSNVPVSYNGYYYRCTVSMNGCVTNTLSTNGLLSVKTNPTVSANANPATICAGQSSNLTGLGANTYVWSTGQVTNPASVSPSAMTTYTVTGTAANGCTNTANVTVNVNPLITPSVTINTSTTTICSGTSAVFNPSPVNGGSSPSYQWRVNGVNKTTNSPSNTSYTNSSLANGDVVTVVMTSNVACGSPLTVTSNAITMTVNPLPTITASATAASVCFKASAQTSTLSYSATSNAPANYTITWNAAAISAGLVNVSSTPLPASPITISVPAGLAAATYTGTLVVTNSNCPSVGNSFTLTVSSTCPNTWIGGNSTDWNTGSNWSLGNVPSSTNDITIPSGTTFKPTITAASTAASLTISSGAEVIITSTGTINVYGNITNSGLFTTAAGSTVAFKGSTAQTVTSVPALYNVEINNTSGGVSIASPLTVNGSISLLNGVLTTNSKLTINFDNGGNIAYNVSDNGSISGNVTGRRDVIARTHYISSPFAGAVSSQIDATTPLYYNGYWKMYTKNFATQGWAAVTDMTTAMPLGTGFSLAYPSASSLQLTGTYNHNFSYTSPAYSNAAAGKYMLIGNPYPSTINWSTIYSSGNAINTGGAVYYWNAANNQVASWISAAGGTNGGTQYIPAMQSFMVATTGTGGPTSYVTINNTTRALNNSSYFRTTGQADNSILKLAVKTTDGVIDETLISLNSDATEDFEFDKDAYKIINSGLTPSLYTSTNAGSTMYSINSLPFDAAETIPLNLKVTKNGTYELKCSELVNQTGYSILLEDKLNNILLPVDTALVYVISANTTDNVDRFVLRFRTNLTTSISLGSSKSIMLSTYNDDLMLTSNGVTEQGVDMKVYDAAGRLVQILADQSITPGIKIIPLDKLPSGVYLVTFTVDGAPYTGKVVIK